MSSLSIGDPVRLLVDRPPSKDERERIQLDWVLRYTHHDELAAGSKTGHKWPYRITTGGGCENRSGPAHTLQHRCGIVTEYFPEGTLEQHSSRFRGNAPAALKAFRSLVQTVAALHKEGYVHRDIKPPNVFVRNDDELVLGDFGIVYVPSAAKRVTLTGERVGPRDYMPQWANLGVRPENVEPCFDVYMLGKLLWSMVDGRIFLPREYHNRPEHPEFDLTKTFSGDPHMFLINRILDKCVVEDASRGSDTTSIAVETFACDSCGHIAFFRTAPQ